VEFSRDSEIELRHEEILGTRRPASSCRRNVEAAACAVLERKERGGEGFIPSRLKFRSLTALIIPSLPLARRPVLLSVRTLLPPASREE